jgi:FkbM family methyltransferase
MNMLQELRDKYINLQISKEDYIQRMYEQFHSKLFEYADYIHQTDVDKIIIQDKDIFLTSKKYGIGIYCPRGDHRVAPIETLNFLSYEEKDADMILRLIPKNGTIFDIGANMGWYSLLIAKLNKNLKIHAFEPIPQTYNYLSKNVKENKLDNIELHNFGLSNENKELIFYTYPEGSGNASTANLSERNNVNEIKCLVRKLDDFVMEKNLNVDFIKCDVEGAELLAFLGAEKTLLKNKPIIFTEMLRKWAAKFNYHPNQIINFFNLIEYRCFYAKDDFLVEFFEMTDKTEETNFFFLHKDLHKDIIKSYLE